MDAADQSTERRFGSIKMRSIPLITPVAPPMQKHTQKYARMPVIPLKYAH
jgi:hypothetical protein